MHSKSILVTLLIAISNCDSQLAYTVHNNTICIHINTENTVCSNYSINTIVVAPYADETSLQNIFGTYNVKTNINVRAVCKNGFFINFIPATCTLGETLIIPNTYINTETNTQTIEKNQIDIEKRTINNTDIDNLQKHTKVSVWNNDQYTFVYNDTHTHIYTSRMNENSSIFFAALLITVILWPAMFNIYETQSVNMEKLLQTRIVTNMYAYISASVVASVIYYLTHPIDTPIQLQHRLGKRADWISWLTLSTAFIINTAIGAIFISRSIIDNASYMPKTVTRIARALLDIHDEQSIQVINMVFNIIINTTLLDSVAYVGYPYDNVCELRMLIAVLFLAQTTRVLKTKPTKTIQSILLYISFIYSTLVVYFISIFPVIDIPRIRMFTQAEIFVVSLGITLSLIYIIFLTRVS